ncbi:hypothetical protein QYF36_004920 [Acer negundo]|nr:hypothetical protein QYF36_004920 [Acer negundo]
MVFWSYSTGTYLYRWIRPTWSSGVVALACTVGSSQLCDPAMVLWSYSTGKYRVLVQWFSRVVAVAPACTTGLGKRCDPVVVF